MRKMNKLHIGLFLLAFGILLFTHTRGLVPHDEGWIVNPANRLLHGDVPYKDFHFIYFPGSLLLSSSLLFAYPSLITLRLFAILISLFSTFLMFKITFSISRNTMFSLLSGVTFLIFGPLTINFLAPTLLAIPAGLAGIFILFHKKSIPYLLVIASGICGALAMLFKQNFGVGLLFVCILGIIVLKQQKVSYLKHFILGFLLGWLPVLLFLFWINGLIPFIEDVWYFTIEKTLRLGLQVTPFFYPGSLLNVIGKSFFYLFPLIISAIACVLCIKKKKELLPFPLFTAMFYIVGIRPTTDYIHLAPLVALCGIPLSIIGAIVNLQIYKRIILILFLIFIGIGFYTISFRHFYRWEDPLIKHENFSTHPKVSLFVNDKSYNSILEIQQILEEYKGEYVFFYDYLPLYYFVTDTKNPTRFDFFPPLSKIDTEEIIYDLKRKNTQRIVTSGNISEDNSEIGKYITSFYTVEKTNYFYVWKKIN